MAENTNEIIEQNQTPERRDSLPSAQPPAESTAPETKPISKVAGGMTAALEAAGAVGRVASSWRQVAVAARVHTSNSRERRPVEVRVGMLGCARICVSATDARSFSRIDALAAPLCGAHSRQALATVQLAQAFPADLAATASSDFL